MIIVTGGAGFIGSNIAIELGKKNQIIICDDLKNCKIKKNNIASIKNKKIIPISSLFDFIDKKNKTIKAIIHMGAITSTAEKNLNLIMSNNYIYSSKLFKICNSNKIKLIYASSAATYGNSNNHFNDNNTFENFLSISPTNYYSLSKHMFDLEVLSNINSNYNPGSNPVGLKFFNVYGPNELHKNFSMSPIPKFYKEIYTKGKVNLFKSHSKLYKNGHQARDFIYVKDIVKVVNFFLSKKKLRGIYNVGTGKSNTFFKLANLVIKNTKKNSTIEYIETPSKIKGGYQYYTKADVSNLIKSGYKGGFTSLENGVKDYINNYLKNTDYKKIKL